MDDHYGAIKFGEFRKYMQNKQAKLKDQERALYVMEFIVEGIAMRPLTPLSFLENTLLPKIRYHRSFKGFRSTLTAIRIRHKAN